jgi:hypothetical protein
MDLKKLLSQKQTLIHHENDDGTELEVKETLQYRWFEYGGSSIQSFVSHYYFFYCFLKYPLKVNPLQISLLIY